MKLFLCSNFDFMAEKYLHKFFDLTKTHTCLFVGYADEEQDYYNEANAKFLENFNFKPTILREGFVLKEKFDMIFVKGGNTTQLIHLLRKFNQFDMLKQLVEEGSLYAGQSAGAVLAGSDTEWTLRSEPYDYDVKAEFGSDALKGLNFVNKMVFVHCSKYRFPFHFERDAATEKYFRVTNTLFYNDYLIDKKRYPKDSYIVLGDNQAYLQNGEEIKIVTLDWSKLPVMDKFKLF